MFTKQECRELLGKVPEDFDDTYKEFWTYIIEKINVVVSRIRWIYIDICQKDLENSFRQEKSIVESLLKRGAQIKVVKAPILKAEIKAWLEMMHKMSSQDIVELYNESVMELSHQVLDVINQTLKELETGCLIIDPLLKIFFHKEIRVIRMFPFNPKDYLNRHRVKIRNQL